MVYRKCRSGQQISDLIFGPCHERSSDPTLPGWPETRENMDQRPRVEANTIELPPPKKKGRKEGDKDETGKMLSK